jgi:chromosome segregation ATPase
MKMSELRLENEALKQQVQLLSQQLDSEKDSPALNQLKEKNRALRKSVKDLKAEKTALSSQIHALEGEKDSLQQDHQAIAGQLEQAQQQMAVLSELHAGAAAEVKTLRQERQALEEKTALLPSLQAEVDRLQQVETLYQEATAQATALQAELDHLRQELQEAKRQATLQAADYQGQLAQSNRAQDELRISLQAELEAERQQSQAQVASLQADKDALSSKVTDLTDKLKLVATHLERQLNEKRKFAAQYETSAKDYQAYKDKTEKQIQELMALLQKMAGEMDALRLAHPTQELQPVSANADHPTTPPSAPAAPIQPHTPLQELQNQLAKLEAVNASQSRELVDLRARLAHFHRALATPLGRFVSPLLGLKD